MSTLLVTKGPGAGLRFELEGNVTLGRATDNRIVIADTLASRYHARLFEEHGQWILEDLKSKNGMVVNGKKATRVTLQQADQFQIGQWCFIFELPQEVATARFSETGLVLRDEPDSHAKMLEWRAPVFNPQANMGPLSVILGELLEADPESLGECLRRLLGELMALAQADCSAILLHGLTGVIRPLVILTPQPTLELSRPALMQVLAAGRASLGRLNAPEAGADSCLMIPLRHRDKVTGLLHLGRINGKSFTRAEAGWLATLAGLLAGVIRCAISAEQILNAPPSPSDHPIIGLSAQTQSIRQQIERIAHSEATVLIGGETGTGKELVAQAIHARSPRARAPFVTIDCSAIPPSLLESELFGHEAGAFTGADRLKRGKVEMAEGGTLFLDEIGELQSELQPKLLRFLETLTFYRVGGLRPLQADVRIVAATNRDLDSEAQHETFRSDLLYRLNVMPINLPPLRERPADVRPLVEHFAPKLATHLGKPYRGVTEEGWTVLLQYPWPGNVRELRHSLERAIILSDDGLLGPEQFQLSMPASDTGQSWLGSGPGQEITHTVARSNRRERALPTLAQAEKEAISRALLHAKGNRVQAAKILQIHRNTLTKKIAEYRLDITQQNKKSKAEDTGHGDL